MDCQHQNKAYSNHGMSLTSYPPINITYWICKDCGWEGQDSQQDKLNTDYDDTRSRFGKGNNTVTVTTPIKNIIN